MKFLKFSRKQTERGYEILKFLGARRFSLRTTTGFLKFTPMPSHNGSEILKFTPEPPRNRSEILNFMFASYKLRLALRKFTPEPRKIKSAPTVHLNFAFNSVPRARTSKFENGVKFKGAAKFERGAR